MSDVTFRFGAADDGLNAQIRRVHKDLEGITAGARGVATEISGIFRSIGIAGLATAALGAMKELIASAAEFAEEVTKIKTQTRFAGDEVQRLMFIADQADVEVSAMTGAVLKLQKALGGLEDDAKGAGKQLQDLGLSNAEFFNSSPAEQFEAVARKIAGLADQNERVAAATGLFGKAGGELLPIIQAIGDESAQLDAAYARIGGPVGDQAIAQVEQMGDAASASAIGVKSLATEVLAVFAPAAEASANTFSEIIGALRFKVREVKRDFAEMTGGEPVFESTTEQVVLLDMRIQELQKQLDNPGFGGNILETTDDIRLRMRRVRNEVEQLTAQLNALTGLNRLEPKLEQLAIDLPAPGKGLQFEESDAARKEREELEKNATLQRLQNRAATQLIERDMEFRHQQELEGISADRIERDIQASANKELRVGKIQSDAAKFYAQVRQTFGLQEIKFEEIKSMSILEIAGMMFNSLASHNSKLAKIQQGIALAETIWATATGIAKAFQTYGPTPAGFVAAAKVALVGVIQVAKIKSTNYSPGSVSGSAPTVAGGGAAVGGQDTGTPDVSPGMPGGATTIYLTGLMTPQLFDYLVGAIRDGFDRDVIIIPANSAQAQVIRG